MYGTRLALFTSLRGNERLLSGAWLAACVLGLAGLGWLGTSSTTGRLIEAWNQRWLERLERGEELFATGDYERAADYLEDLDADSPALLGKHRYGFARIRLLELLGRSQAELGRKRRALDALERLVAFDPRGWPGYYLLAETCLRLGEPAQAEEAYRQVLAIHPNHLPTVEALIGMKYEAGLYAEVPALFEAYLDAWFVARLVVQLGEREVLLGLPVDGREQVLETGFTPPAEPRAQVCLETSGFSVELFELELVPARRAGDPAWGAALGLPVGPGWSARDAHFLPDGSCVADGPGSLLCSAVPPVEVGRVRLRLRAFKAVGSELWKRVEKSYRNVLDLDGLELVRARTRVGGCALAGSEPGTPDSRLEAWTARCEHLFESGAALDVLEQLVATAPDPFTSQPLLPKSMIVRYRFEIARRGALERLAELLMAAGEEARALSALEHLVALEPNDWRHHSGLAALAGRTGHTARAAEAYDALLALRPDGAPGPEADE